MRIITRTDDIFGYIFTNRIHVCLMPIILTAFWNIALKLPLPIYYYIMIFFTTFGGYIYNMYTDQVEDNINYNKKYKLFNHRNYYTKICIGVCFFLGFLLALPAGIWFVLYGGLVNMLGSLYSMPIKFKIFGKITQTRIKEIPFIKNIYVALFWSFGLICTPYLYMGESIQTIINPMTLIVIVVSFGMNYFLELMWDIRDVQGDTEAGVKTIVVAMGQQFALKLLYLVHTINCTLLIVSVYYGILPIIYYIAIIHFFIGLLYLRWYVDLKDKDLASHIYLLYGAFLMLLSIIISKFMG